MKMLLTTLLITRAALWASVLSLQAANIYVETPQAHDSPTQGTGTQEDLYNHIQLAVDAAPTGDIIRVDPGTYDENIVFESKHQVNWCPWVDAGNGEVILRSGFSPRTDHRNEFPIILLRNCRRVYIYNITLQCNAGHDQEVA